jgi:hypothetical protein
MRRTREDWKRVLAELRASGMGTTEFARKRHINPKTLQWWAWELRNEASAELVQFVPVEAVASVRPACRVMEAQAGAVTLRFESGTDVEYVAALLDRLSAAC